MKAYKSSKTCLNYDKSTIMTCSAPGNKKPDYQLWLAKISDKLGLSHPGFYK